MKKENQSFKRKSVQFTASKRAYEKENSHGPRAVFPMNIINSFVSITAAWNPVGKKPKTT
jgi:hypothetical protein